MFDYKHKISFKNSESISLFGEDYFGDKSTFWYSHQSALKNLCERVCLIGFPLKVDDLKNAESLNILNKDEFDSWMLKNQPYKCDCEQMKFIATHKIDSITCGIFNSNSWGESSCYRIFSNHIQLDSSRNYWSQRFSKKGYRFEGLGMKIAPESFIRARLLLNQVPSACFELPLPSPNSPGNKDEYEIFIQVDLLDGKSVQFKIDEYDSRDLSVDEEILKFKDRVKETVLFLDRECK